MKLEMDENKYKRLYRPHRGIAFLVITLLSLLVALLMNALNTH
jgi:hypothetical protein